MCTSANKIVCSSVFGEPNRVLLDYENTDVQKIIWSVIKQCVIISIVIIEIQRGETIVEKFTLNMKWNILSEILATI